MIKPPKPDNELERLNALIESAILDTPPEEAFDMLTKLAAQICGTEFAAISLIDSDRQWFKSKVGFEDESTSRDISFCGHAILDTNTLEVYDSLADERFHDNPLVSEAPHIRFYAGAPLIDSKGFALGTLCVFDSKVRSLEDYQKNALKTFASKIIALMERKYK